VFFFFFYSFLDYSRIAVLTRDELPLLTVPCSRYSNLLLPFYLLSTLHHQVRNAPLTPGLAACGLQPGTVLYVDGFDGLDYFVRYVPLAALTTG
jgi:hypothetical protein